MTLLRHETRHHPSLVQPPEADLIRSRLEAAEFQVFVAHAGASLALEGYALTAGGILVQVPEDQAEEAMALLAAE